MSALQLKMRRQLAGGQFRHLNETLYTQSGSASLAMMAADPSLFSVYHEGFRVQVGGWPVNPLDVVIAKLSRLPRGTVVADFGCGEGRLGATLGGTLVVHSFDLGAPPGVRHITITSSTRVPLPDASVDVCVFCLALMGTDYLDCVSEAARVGRDGGTLIVAEVRSRLEGGGNAPATHPPSGGGKKRPREAAAGGGGGGGGGGGRGTSSFLAGVASRGWKLTATDDTSTMFVIFTFTRAARGAGRGGSAPALLGQAAAAAEAAAQQPLRPCVYKKR